MGRNKPRSKQSKKVKTRSATNDKGQHKNIGKKTRKLRKHFLLKRKINAIGSTSTLQQDQQTEYPLTSDDSECNSLDNSKTDAIRDVRPALGLQKLPVLSVGELCKSEYRTDYFPLESFPSQREISDSRGPSQSLKSNTEGRIFHPNNTESEQLPLASGSIAQDHLSSLKLEENSDKNTKSVPSYASELGNIKSEPSTIARPKQQFRLNKSRTFIDTNRLAGKTYQGKQSKTSTQLCEKPKKSKAAIKQIIKVTQTKIHVVSTPAPGTAVQNEYIEPMEDLNDINFYSNNQVSHSDFERATGDPLSTEQEPTYSVENFGSASSDQMTTSLPRQYVSVISDQTTTLPESQPLAFQQPNGVLPRSFDTIERVFHSVFDKSLKWSKAKRRCVFAVIVIWSLLFHVAIAATVAIVVTKATGDTCKGTWSDWGACDVTCGGGMRTRTCEGLTTHQEENCNEECCPQTDIFLDLIFAIDTSGSMSDESNDIETLVLEILTNITIGQNNAKISLITYNSNSVLTHWDFASNTSISYADLETEFGQIMYDFGDESICDAITQAADVFADSGRPCAPNIIIIISDGSRQCTNRSAIEEVEFVARILIVDTTGSHRELVTGVTDIFSLDSSDELINMLLTHC